MNRLGEGTVFMTGTNKIISASVLVPTYNHPDFVRRTLIGLSLQTRTDFEVIICDDGSGPEISKIIDDCPVVLQGRISHCWQEDKGFRKCRILNEGVLRSASDYLIFLDADCIPHSHFIEGHLCARMTGFYLVGRRVQLGEKVTGRLSDDNIISGRLEWIWLNHIGAVIRGEIRHVEAGVYLPWLDGLGLGRCPKIKGCNFSSWKADIEKINGFNEDFITAGGGEDDDIERRLILSGICGKSVKNTAICYHQYHSLVTRQCQSSELCRRLTEQKNIVCEHGLKQHATDK
ncbi:MAG: glycosyltransferase [Kiritimatiellae bacterium]|nr:glycosyltransferase [Kiritimatiellia bacterium]MDD5522335.1 glycosyltransferase [Kiritimatiellia bacterium]